MEIFAVPILDKTLLYPLLHNLLALVDHRAASACLQLQQIFSILKAEAQPLFLGLIPTRCAGDFNGSDHDNQLGYAHYLKTAQDHLPSGFISLPGDGGKLVANANQSIRRYISL